MEFNTIVLRLIFVLIISYLFISRSEFTLVQYVDATWITYMWWVYVFGLIWISEFILACQQMVVAGAVARWYFNG